MRAVVQRVRSSSLRVGGELVSQIERGLTVLISVGKDDSLADAVWIAQKILKLKIFSLGGRMEQNVVEVSGDILAISQFTLHADVKKGKRPSFDRSAPREHALKLIGEVVSELKKSYSGKIVEGRFGEEMEIELTLVGPVTIWLDSKTKG